MTAFALIILAVGLQLASLLETPLEAKPASALSLEDEGSPRVVSGVVRKVGEKSFLVCSKAKCVRVLQKIPQTFEGRVVSVEGMVKEGALAVKKFSVDVLD